jgi:hypothetical protein
MAMRSFGGMGVVLVMTIAGCSSNSGASKSPNAACDSDHMAGGVCTGVSTAALCSSDTCTDDVSCSTVTTATDDASLTSALASATSGSCVALASGSYGDVALPGGVSLLGRGSSFASVGSVLIAKGDGAVVRGVQVGGAGITISGATNVTIDSVAVIASTKNGITANAGSSLTIASSEIQGSARYGVFATDAASLAMSATSIDGSLGPGVWSASSKGCAGAALTTTMNDVVLRDNQIIGLSLVGMQATLDNVVVRDNPVDNNFNAAGGIAASQCSTLNATSLQVLNNTSYGVLVDQSAASLGSPDATKGASVNGNRLGIWIQNLDANGTQPVSLENCSLDSNSGVGIGLSGKSPGISIKSTRVTSTASITLPTLTNGVQGSSNVGDGLSWQGGAAAVIEGLTLKANARTGIVIDGAVGANSSITNSSIADAESFIEQDIPMSGNVPTIGTGLPAPQLSADATLDIAAAPVAPVEE